MAIPSFLENGLLPPGLYQAELSEIEGRFGKSTKRRQELFERLKMFVELAHHCGALKILINGSFVTAKPEPEDVDVVIRLDQYHEELISQGDSKALELERIFETREPKEAFAAYYEDRWTDWVKFFSSVKGSSTLRKGLVEIKP
ncbi:MAG: hypothetical protein ONB44_24860 [candidate division KSB1 bacterium]|nr:hypothetical protein [candidate division KSB1 bacterium]MDZ7305365.1 hypothetical protein [candidate division KSB1 bacterium]MDZ7314457.1 hypothetical protein [candidate division KSB1 bacterium]